jgi:hypothetical protein
VIRRFLPPCAALLWCALAVAGCSDPPAGLTGAAVPVTATLPVVTSTAVPATLPALSNTPTTPPGATTRPPATHPATTAPHRPPALWTPAPGTAWQWQLTNPVDLSVDVPVYDVDGTYTTPDEVTALHAKGRKVVCYVDAGAYENFRPDDSAFPASVLGRSNDWPGERWLDIRQLAVLRPIMAARFDTCRNKGFDAIEADEVDGYTENTGFPLTSHEQLTYNTMLAQLAHQRGLSIALKNDVDQVPQLVGVFDFAIDEQCFEFDECATLLPFVRAGKAVLEVEYNLSNSQFCPRARAMGFSSMRKNLALDPPRWAC